VEDAREGADLVSRAAYLSGLAQGLDLGATEEGRVLEGVLGLLEDMARQVWRLSGPETQGLTEPSLAEGVTPLAPHRWAAPVGLVAVPEVPDRPVFVACECPRCGEDVFVEAEMVGGPDAENPQDEGPREMGITCPNCGEAVLVREQPSAGEWLPVNDQGIAPRHSTASRRPFRRPGRSPTRPGPGSHRHVRRPEHPE
jgi:DNA-directed RNA polymerase subunit RPC12/RpoP